MGRLTFSSLVVCLIWAGAHAQPDSRTVVGAQNELLASGAEAMRAGRYDEGIRLTVLGLEEETPSDAVRAAALANLCAAHAAKDEPDAAIRFCDESISLAARNWRAYSNRAYAHLLKGRYAEAERDIDAAAAIAPGAPQVEQIRGMINERRLVPRVTMEDRQ